MKSNVFAFVVGAVAAASRLPAVSAWWDNAHMLVGQVATQLMAPADVATIHSVLAKWNADFPNTDTIATAAIWPDLIKCTSQASYCLSDLMPSLNSMGDWHYVDLPLAIDGGAIGGLSPDDLALFNYTLGGTVIDQLEASVKTLATTNSTWAANFVLRNFIHFFGDLHQPLHAVAGINKGTGPAGDAGGNAFKFRTPCTFSNLHALWDAAGGVYSGNNWSPDPKVTPDAALAPNATYLIGLLPLVTDAVSFEAYQSLSYAQFMTAAVTNDRIFRRVALDSRKLADAVVYKGLNLTIGPDGAVACPPQWYMDWAAQYSQFRVALGGKRLAVVLTQFAQQLRAKKLAM